MTLPTNAVLIKLVSPLTFVSLDQLDGQWRVKHWWL